MVVYQSNYFESSGYVKICEEEGYISNTEQEVNFVIGEMSRLFVPQPRKILDVGCGDGRHSILLAKKGFEVVGVDVSKKLIEKASNKTSTTYGVIKPQFLVKDMREISFHDEFDCVVFFFSVFGIFDRETNLEILRRVRKALKRNGIIILDLWNLFAFISYINSKGMQVKREVSSLKIKETYKFCPETLMLDWQEVHLNEGVKESYWGKYQFYVPSLLDEDLRKNKLYLKEAFGSFDKKPYNAFDERIIVVAQKV